jgi:predicted dienelactone hydrolase
MMISMLRSVAFWLVVFCFAPLSADAPAYSVTDITWHDSLRDRDVPARIYAPTSGQGPFPVIIFSHGLGGSKTGYAYLGEYWASYGYIVVHVQHLGSDSAVLWPLQKMSEAMKNPENYINRPKDISFAIDQLTAMNVASGSWHGRLDLSHIGVAGHSFGGYTTMAIAGATLRESSGEIENFRDPRVKAIVAMSVPPIKSQDFSAVQIPAFHVTGTDDQIRIVPGDSVADRRIPYDEAKGPDTYLVIFKGANHMSFSGREGLLETDAQKAVDATVHDLVLRSTVAFWDAYLKDDLKAKTWLARGGFAQTLGVKGTFEEK